MSFGITTIIARNKNMNILHQIKHILHLNSGNPRSHLEGDKLVMCFRCECGEESQCFDITGSEADILKDIDEAKKQELWDIYGREEMEI